MTKQDFISEEKLSASNNHEKIDFIIDDRYNPMNVVGVQHNELLSMLMQNQTDSIEKNIQMAAQWYCKADGSFINTFDKTFIDKLQIEGKKVISNFQNSKASMFDILEGLKMSDSCKQELKWLLDQILQSEGQQNIINSLEAARSWEKRIMSTDWIAEERTVLLSALSTARYSAHYWVNIDNSDDDANGGNTLKASKKCVKNVITVCADVIGAVAGGIAGGVITGGNPAGVIIGGAVVGGACSGIIRTW
jgi:hypothetical protein